MEKTRTYANRFRAASGAGSDPVVYDENLTKLVETTEDVTESLWHTEKGRSLSNECEHRVGIRHYSLPTSPVAHATVERAAGSSVCGVITREEPSIVFPHPANMTRVDTTDGFDLNGIKAAQVHKAFGLLNNYGLKPVMSIPRAVIELKDLPQLWGSLKDLGHFLKWLNRPSRGYSANGLTNLTRFSTATVKQASSAYLAWKFGVEPTVGDLNKFRRSMKNLLFVSQNVVFRKGERIRSGLSCSTFDPSSVYGSSKQVSWLSYHSAIPKSTALSLSIPILSRLAINYAGSGCEHSSMPLVEAAGFVGCCYAQVAENVAFEDDLAIRTEFASPFLTTMWEVARLTFLVDWVCDVGSWLERMERTHAVNWKRHIPFTEGIWTSIREFETLYVPKPLMTWNLTKLEVTDIGSMVDVKVEGATQKSWSPYVPLSTQLSYDRFPQGLPLSRPVLSGRFKPYMLGTGAALLLANIKPILRDAEKAGRYRSKWR